MESFIHFGTQESDRKNKVEALTGWWLDSVPYSQFFHNPLKDILITLEVATLYIFVCNNHFYGNSNSQAFLLPPTCTTDTVLFKIPFCSRKYHGTYD